MKPKGPIFGKALTGIVGEEFFGVGWGASSASGIPVNLLTAMHCSAVLACVTVIAEDMSKIPIRVMRRLPNGSKEEIEDHFMTRLLRNPNSWQSFGEWCEETMAHLLLYSNSYSVIKRNSRGEATELVPVPPDRVTLREAPGGEWFFYVSRSGLHEMAVLRDFDTMIEAESILHIRWMTLWNSLMGVPRISLSRETIGLAMSLEAHLAHVMGQGTRPGGLLKTARRLNPESVNQLKSSWQEGFSGPNKSGLTAVLEDGMEWQPMSIMNNNDAQLVELRLFQLKECCRTFRVPPHKVGLPIEGGTATMVQADQNYVNEVLLTWSERILRKLEEMADIDGRRVFLEHDFDHLMKADIKTRSEVHALGVSRMKYTPNEVRSADGLPPVPGGDVVYQPVNFAPLGSVPVAGTPGPGSDLTDEAGEGGDGSPGGGPFPGDEGAPGV